MSRMTTAEAVIETLIAHGIDTLFALPGVHNDSLFDAAHAAAHRATDRLRVIHPRHEQTAAYMALGAALVTGRPQAFAVVPGPGVLNASAALLLANAMGAPVIALAGQIPSFAIDQGHGHLHEIHDQIGLLRHITKDAARIRSPQEASGPGGMGDRDSDHRPPGCGRAGMRHRHLGPVGRGHADAAGDPARRPAPTAWRSARRRRSWRNPCAR